MKIHRGQLDVVDFRDSDVLVAQVIAVANESFRRELGALPAELAQSLDGTLRAVLSL